MEMLNGVSDVSKFLRQSQESLDKILKILKWTPETLLSDKRGIDKLSCPVNSNHWISKDCVDSHIKTCRISNHGYDSKDLLPSSDFYYESVPSVVSVAIDKSRYESFKGVSVPSKQHISVIDYKNSCTIIDDDIEVEDIRDPNASLIDRTTYNVATSPRYEIRNIMQWELIPSIYDNIDIQQLDMAKLKSWLIKNLPKHGSFRSVIDGDIQLLNFICSCLGQPSTAHPDRLINQLKELLAQNTRSFVLKLWKYMCILMICKKNAISEDEMNGIISVTTIYQGKKSENIDEISTENIDEIPSVTSSDSAGSDVMSLPMDFVRFDLTQLQMLKQYDHVVKMGKAANKAGEVDLSDLAFGVDGNAKNEDERDSKSHLEMMAEMRDYKRRRQSYRAKNVHITKRSATDKQRDLLEVMMGAMESIHKKNMKKTATEVASDSPKASYEMTRLEEGSDRQDERQHKDDKERGESINEDYKRAEHRGQRQRQWNERDRNRDRNRDRDRERERHGRDRRRSRSRERDSERDKNRHKHRHKHR